MTEWIEIIEYRDFHDVPRIFVIIVDGRTFLFDCPFDGNLDDYSDEYEVYELDEMTLGSLPDDWTGLSRLSGGCKGRVAVSTVTFDSTKRKQVDGAVLIDLLA